MKWSGRAMLSLFIGTGSKQMYLISSILSETFLSYLTQAFMPSDLSFLPACKTILANGHLLYMYEIPYKYAITRRCRQHHYSFHSWPIHTLDSCTNHQPKLEMPYHLYSYIFTYIHESARAATGTNLTEDTHTYSMAWVVEKLAGPRLEASGCGPGERVSSSHPETGVRTAMLGWRHISRGPS